MTDALRWIQTASNGLGSDGLQWIAWRTDNNPMSLGKLTAMRTSTTTKFWLTVGDAAARMGAAPMPLEGVATLKDAQAVATLILLSLKENS